MSENYDYMGLVIGEAGQLDARHLRKSLQDVVRLIHNVAPTTAIDIAIAGYDEDPREIFQIPEARRYVIAFAVGLVEAKIPLERLLPISVQLISICLAAEKGQEVVVRDEPVIDVQKEIAEHQERARRKMN